MTDEIRSLMLDLVEWIAKRPRSYREVMEAWRTSCPRMPVWEEAVDRGLVVRQRKGKAGAFVSVTKAGLAFLEAEGRLVMADPPPPPQEF